jgi:hypothetical protein
MKPNKLYKRDKTQVNLNTDLHWAMDNQIESGTIHTSHKSNPYKEHLQHHSNMGINTTINAQHTTSLSVSSDT